MPRPGGSMTGPLEELIGTKLMAFKTRGDGYVDRRRVGFGTSEGIEVTSCTIQATEDPPSVETKSAPRESSDGSLVGSGPSPQRLKPSRKQNNSVATSSWPPPNSGPA
ncbi:hypothetical protein BS17DRAFT_782490 [Gyrodon lividus]|nr:hypothetical protein BS17DRAFT_782490 [Gyrodon lividus]